MQDVHQRMMSAIPLLANGRRRVPSAHTDHVRSRRRVALALATGMTLAGSTAAVGAPMGRVTAGWPVFAPAQSSLHLGTDGGPVLVSDGLGSSLVAAWTPTGARRWINTFEWGCGNCAVLQPDASRPGGPYGPLGPYGVRVVSPTGRSIPAYAVLADGTRITIAWGATQTDASTTTATRGSVQLWSRADPFLDEDRFDVSGGFVVTDGTRLYRGFGSTSTPTIALDATNGRELWRVENARPLIPFGTGVLVQLANGHLAGFDAAGTALFEVPIAAPFPDAAHHRLYTSSPDRIDAYDTASGALLWSRPRARALSVTPGGLVLAAITMGDRPALQAIGADGVGRWRYETTMPVTSARALPDGTIVLAVNGVDPTNDAGLLMRINPAVAGVRPERSSVALTRTTFRADCYDAATMCGVSSSRGTMLRIASRTRTTMSVRLLFTNGTVMVPWTRISVPVGTSLTRIAAGRATGRIQVRRGTAGSIIVDRRVTVTS